MMLKRTLFVLLLAGFVVAALIGANHYAPLQPIVTFAYLGLGLAFAGLISVIKPLGFLGIRRRTTALVVLVVGAAVFVGALMWPASARHAAGAHQRLDDFMPSFEFHEFHATRAHASPAHVADAIRTVTVADIPVAGWLMRIRAMASGNLKRPKMPARPIVEKSSRPGGGFLPLDPDGSNEVVYGFVGRPWTNGPRPRVMTPEEFIAFQEPGNVKVAFNIAWRDVGGGVTAITTETRITGTDDQARRTFARYWRVIYPGSAIIRRAWIDAIVAKAERAPTRQ
jgi:hypothetical protein